MGLPLYVQTITIKDESNGKLPIYPGSQNYVDTHLECPTSKVQFRNFGLRNPKLLGLNLIILHPPILHKEWTKLNYSQNKRTLYFMKKICLNKIDNSLKQIQDSLLSMLMIIFKQEISANADLPLTEIMHSSYPHLG